MSEDPLTWAILALHCHITPFWDVDDPGIESLPLVFGSNAQYWAG